MTSQEWKAQAEIARVIFEEEEEKSMGKSMGRYKLTFTTTMETNDLDFIQDDLNRMDLDVPVNVDNLLAYGKALQVATDMREKNTLVISTVKLEVNA